MIDDKGRGVFFALIRKIQTTRICHVCLLLHHTKLMSRSHYSHYLKDKENTVAIHHVARLYWLEMYPHFDALQHMFDRSIYLTTYLIDFSILPAYAAESRVLPSLTRSNPFWNRLPGFFAWGPRWMKRSIYGRE